MKGDTVLTKSKSYLSVLICIFKMSKKKFYKATMLIICLLLMIAFCLYCYPVPVTAQSQFAGGTGSLEDPYLISTPDHLNSIRNHLDAHFKQIADIDLGKAPWNDNQGWKPIGTGASPFMGSYKGNSYRIANITIDDPCLNYAGLFGCAKDAILLNMTIENVDIKAKNDVGALAGFVYFNSSIVIENSSVCGSIEGNEFVGGLVGYSDDCYILGSSFTGNVTGSGDYVGGLAGTIGGLTGNSGTIAHCNSDVIVSSSGDYIGGLVGSGRIIENSHTAGSVTGRRYVGGLAGRVGGVTGSSSNSRVNGANYDFGFTGGLVGSTTNIEKSYATGRVFGGGSVGGVAGNANGIVNYSYATGNVFGSNDVGGLVGSGGHITNSSASGYVRGNRYVGGLVGRGVHISGSNAVGDVNGSSRVGGLAGSATGNVTRSNAVGKVTGGGYVGGLIGYNEDGQVTKSFATGEVEGLGRVGGLIGYGRIISDCFATGNVTGIEDIGGLAGVGFYVENCYSVGPVTGDYFVGGLVGRNTYLVLKSYYDRETSGQSDLRKGTPKTTEEMQQGTPSTRIYTDWSKDIWNFKPQDEYPWLDIPYTSKPSTYNVSVKANPSNSGTIQGSGTYVEGVEVTLIALANDSYEFINWSEGGEKVYYESNYTFIVEGDRHLEANFQHKAIERLSGIDRYITAIEISKAGWDSADTVILTNGHSFPDALAGVPLAYSLNAPILLTDKDELVQETSDEIERLGAKRIIILGGSAAVSDAVKDEIKAAVGLDKVERIGGINRYDTARLIAVRLQETGNYFNKAFITYGQDFPDALSTASYAAIEGVPILLTHTDSIPTATVEALDDLGINNTVVVGGTAVISEDVADKLPNCDRVSGVNRYETAVALSETYMPKDTKHIYIATGINFPDALVGGVLAAKNNSGILLVRGTDAELPDSVKEFIEYREINGASIFGGPAAVSSSIINDVSLLLD